MRLHAAATLFLACLACVGCGGGGGAEPPVTVTLVSSPTLDGTIGANGFLAVGGDVAPADVESPENTTGLRGFVSFDLATIPPGADIQAATLSLFQGSVVNDPYGTLGSLFVDKVVYGNVLEAGAYSRSGPAVPSVPFLSDATLGTKSVDVTQQLASDMTAQRAQAQFRLRFTIELNSNGDSDQAIFRSAATAQTADQAPKLVVTYRP